MYKLTSSTSVIRLADNACVPNDPANSDRQVYEQWLAEGNTPEPIDPPTQDQVVAAYIATLEAHYDSVAQQRRYDNRLTCALRAGYPGPFQAEGAAFGSWMDRCNAYAYAQLDAVLAGTRAKPTEAALIAELPPMVWPQ